MLVVFNKVVAQLAPHDELLQERLGPCCALRDKKAGRCRREPTRPSRHGARGCGAGHFKCGALRRQVAKVEVRAQV